ncbi:MAG: SDR family NAD(P)-dependent oxidoreductase [Deltaproteobacteria bacterium]|nr:SDR family NAD(P)-dependent oxidoreductase [Deltaproteobacteria bacterium]
MPAMGTILITGANAGLGKEAARLLAAVPGVRKIILGCRNQAKAMAAKAELEAATGAEIFEFVRIDTTDLDVVRAAVRELPERIDGLILNAGGAGGPEGHLLTQDGVTGAFAVNVLGHAALVEGLIAARKLRGTVIYVGSEAARGIPGGAPRPDLKTSSVDEFATIADGSVLPRFNTMTNYGLVKYMGTMWAGSMARRHPEIRFVVVSPGATAGTKAADDMTPLRGFFFGRVAMPMMRLFGWAHGVEEGAERYVTVLLDDAYATGRFYASVPPGTSGALVDQSPYFEDLTNHQFQDHAYQALQRFLRTEPAATGRGDHAAH